MREQREEHSTQTDADPQRVSAEDQAAMRQFEREMVYYETHWEELLGQYPEQWVAIHQERVVGAAPGLDNLLTALQERGIPIGEALVEFVTHSEELLIV